MKKGLKALTLLISSIGAFNASADEQKNFYVQSNLGIAFGGYPGKDFEQNSMGNSGVYGLALGYKFTDHFRADFGVERRGGFKHKYISSEYSDAGKVLDSHKTTVKSWSVMATGYYDIVEMNKFTPYVLLGVGIARNTTEYNGDAELENKSQPPIHYTWEKGNKINFAWKVGAGVKYKINDSFDVGLNYQYIDLGKFNTGNTTYQRNSIEVFPTETTNKHSGKLKSQEILINFIFKF